MTSGIFNVPLPPNLTGLNLMCWTLVEIFNKWQDEHQLYIRYIKTISILALLWIFGTNLIKIFYFKFIYDEIFFLKLIVNLITIAVIGYPVIGMMMMIEFYFRSRSIQKAQPYLTQVRLGNFIIVHIISVAAFFFHVVFVFLFHLLYAVDNGGRFIFKMSCFWRSRGLRGNPLGSVVFDVCFLVRFVCFFFLLMML